MLNLYIIGAGGLGRGLADALVYDSNAHIKEKIDNIFFVDDNQVNTVVNDISVKYDLENFMELNEKCLVINAIGIPNVRKEIQEKLNGKNNFIFPNFIDSDVKIYSNVIIGKGNIITRGAVLSTNINIGNFNLIHFNCTVGHDVQIGDFNCIYPLSSLSGYIQLGNENMIGTGTSILPGSIINNNVKVAANSLIKDEYSSNMTVIGTPARQLDK